MIFTTKNHLLAHMSTTKKCYGFFFSPIRDGLLMFSIQFVNIDTFFSPLPLSISNTIKWVVRFIYFFLSRKNTSKERRTKKKIS